MNGLSAVASRVTVSSEVVVERVQELDFLPFHVGGDGRVAECEPTVGLEELHRTMEVLLGGVDQLEARRLREVIAEIDRNIMPLSLVNPV